MNVPRRRTCAPEIINAGARRASCVPIHCCAVTPAKAAQILFRTRLALLVGAAGLAALWAWRGAGLFALLANIQATWPGRSDRVFTLLFTFLTLFVVAMALGSLVTSVFRRRFSPEEWQDVLHGTKALWDRSSNR